MLIQRIVSSESGVKGKGQLLNISVQRLVEIAKRKNVDSESETKDVPQAHALHILQVIVNTNFE